MKKKTNQEFLLALKNIKGADYIALEKYKGSHEKILIHHIACGKNFYMAPKELLYKNNCPICYGTHKYTTNEYVQLLKNKKRTDVELVDQYDGMHTPVHFRCVICKYIFLARPCNILSGTGCPKCHHTYSPTAQEYANYISSLTDGEYTLIDYYTNNKDVLTYKHNACGHEFHMSANNFYRYEIPCPYCRKSYYKNHSRSEFSIINWLKTFYDDEIIHGSRSIIAPYELDIFLPDLHFAIEYNGDYWHSETIMQKKYGKTADEYHTMKQNLCEAAGVDLIFIWEHEWTADQEAVKTRIQTMIQNKMK